MAFKDFGKGKDGGPMTPVSNTGVGALTAFIDQGSEFSGKLSFKDTVRIDGRFEGEISSENTLIVGETGSITATIRSQMIVISGEVHGEITATGQVVLHKTARVDGNIHTARLVVEDGAVFTGRIEMNQKPGKASPAPAAPAKGPAPAH
jgi:cytoskeletal protein CcmA (bactofilin family)